MLRNTSASYERLYDFRAYHAVYSEIRTQKVQAERRLGVSGAALDNLMQIAAGTISGPPPCVDRCHLHQPGEPNGEEDKD